MREWYLLGAAWAATAIAATCWGAEFFLRGDKVNGLLFLAAGMACMLWAGEDFSK